MLIVDAHQDLACTLARTGRDFASRDPRFSLSLEGLREGGVGLILATIFAPDLPDKETVAAERQVEIYRELASEHPGELQRILQAQELDALAPGGPTGMILLLEGADPVETPSALGRFHDWGVRVVGPTWNNANAYAGGVGSDQGLTAAGRDLLRAMADLRMILDVSHLNDLSFREVLDVWDGPVVATHSNARAIAAHRRNLADWQIDALAERRCVIGLNFFRGFLVDAAAGGRPATVRDLLRHADHILGRAGLASLGIGTDYDGGFGPEECPLDLPRVEDLARLPGVFRDEGWPEETIRAILGGNWLRVLRQAF